MWPFRRRHEETLNEMLLRDAGLDGSQPDPPTPSEPPSTVVDPYPAQQPLGVWARAMARPAESDVVTTAHAPGLLGSTVEFAALPSGDLIVDQEDGSADLSPLAEAVERELKPPYRARGSRADGDLWAVTANEIAVLSFHFDDGDELELVTRGGETKLTVDEAPAPGTIPELESAGRACGTDYAVHAERLDGDFWEVRAAAL